MVSMTRNGAWLLILAVACGGERDGSGAGSAPSDNAVAAVPGVAERVAVIEGLSSPESVRYDPDQDIWFIGNFNGDGDVRDGNGFVTRVAAETDSVQTLRFAVGTVEVPLHAPRGMTITGDTLWVVDIDGLHGFDRRSGEQRAFVDLTAYTPGFLNDVVQGPDGALYVTDTGRSAVYRIDGRDATEALADTLLGGPNGITFDAAGGVLVLVPWVPGHPVHRWRPGEAPVAFGPDQTPGRLDGVEIVDGRVLAASQTDSTLSFVGTDGLTPAVRVAGNPADIAVDTRRGRVAVPYLALNRVDIWVLPR